MLAWLLLAQALGAAADAPVRVPRFRAAPAIDGLLTEAAWRESACLTSFVQTQPGDNTPPSHPTEVCLGYDRRALYIGVRAADERGRVRASVAARDAVLDDDHVRIFLDTFDDRRRAYLLAFNPLGIQQDGIWTEGGEPDYSVDVVMESKGLLTGEGYTIEIAVPFRSLRYEAGDGRRWGVHVLRRIKRLDDEEDSWRPLVRGQAGFLAQAGHITGFDDLAPERPLEIVPSLVSSRTGRRQRGPGAERFVDGPLDVDPGLSAKLGLAPNATLDVALNPDFAQVEADAPVVTANQRFPLFFEEKRPFFLEGVDLFESPLKAVHTRTVIDPDFAFKLSGKRGRTVFGALVASDAAPGNFSADERQDPALRPQIEPLLDRNARVAVLRMRRDLGSESSLGLLATSYDFAGEENRLAGVDGRFALDPRTVLTFQLLGTTARRAFYDPDLGRDVTRFGKGLGYFAQVRRTGRHLDLNLTGEGRTRDYTAQAGFTRQAHTNAWSLVTRYNSEPRPQARLISWSFAQTVFGQFDGRARMTYAYLYPRIELSFRRQTYLKLYAYADYARVFEEEFGPRRNALQGGAFAGRPERRTVYKGFSVEAGTTPSERYSASLTLDRAWDFLDLDLGGGPRFPRVSPAALDDPQAPLDPGPGATLDLTATFRWQPRPALRVSAAYTKSRLVRYDTRRVAYDQDLGSFQSTFQFTRFAFVRARADFDSLRSNLRAQLLLAFTPRPGTSLYVGCDDDLSRNGTSPLTGVHEPGLRRNQRVFFVKMSYLLQRTSGDR